MAEQLAAMLRGMKDRTGRALGEEAFVLHTRKGSLVTVGARAIETPPKVFLTVIQKDGTFSAVDRL